MIMDMGHLLLQVMGDSAAMVSEGVARRRSARRVERAGLVFRNSGSGDGMGRWMMAGSRDTAAASTFPAAALKSA